jgi:hypothetical protein
MVKLELTFSREAQLPKCKYSSTVLQRLPSLRKQTRAMMGACVLQPNEITLGYDV